MKDTEFSVDPVSLEVLRNALAMVAEEMSANLVRTSYSPNIKERKDSSCALFDTSGSLVAQAENIPVHLGAMPRAVRAVLDEFKVDQLGPGDVIIHNDPYEGGVHLPDITMVSPVYDDDESLIGFVANRAHHADVGGTYSGSLSTESKSIFAEGLQIPPVKLVKEGKINDEILRFILTNVRTPREREGDLRAQIAANYTGKKRLKEIVEEHGKQKILKVYSDVMKYSEKRMRKRIQQLPEGRYRATDCLDNDGLGNKNLSIEVQLEVEDNHVLVDFTGTCRQTDGPVNAPVAVTESAAYYSLRAVTDPSIPPNQGCYRPITIKVPSGSLLNPTKPAPVVGGNLETSQRIVDVIFSALAEAEIPSIPANSNGSMNNVTFGSGQGASKGYTFYETIGGGLGGRPNQDGVDGIHCHMTNTRNTPAEVIEQNYPLRVERYALRQDTGGAGEYRGGLGLIREIRVLDSGTEFSLLSDRRCHRPRGLNGGKSGAPGKDRLFRDGEKQSIPGKITMELDEGDLISIKTPGGGGYGSPRNRSPDNIKEDLEEGKISKEKAKKNYPHYTGIE
ncbi:hydantoinase B/oxoprolinase family protein [Candidatus Bipolaricaulota bacterium]|nr:hydantoinase B/oxoprolinase family protein [Candidatus Bipolaricaulota bacterium]